MAESLPSTSENPTIEKLGRGLLIADTTSHDPITPTCPFVEIQHTESSLNSPDGETYSTAVVMAEVVEESAATDEDVELRNALERDFCRITIEQAEIETACEGLEAVDEEERKDVGKVKLDRLHEEKNAGKVRLDSLREENDEETAVTVEDEDVTGWGNINEVTVQIDNLHEEKGGKTAESFEDGNENESDNMENEGTVKLDNLHKEKGKKTAECVEDENENGWGDIENEGKVKLGYLHEERGGKNAENIEDENGFGWGNIENEGTLRPNYLHGETGGKNAGRFDDEIGNRRGNVENKWCYEENEGNVGSKSPDTLTRLGRYNPSHNNRSINYPMRPDAEDCAFYMRFGSCKFGLICKFNHPPKRKNQGVKDRANHSEDNSERAGQTECKYYLTSGGCRYGKDCKYSHGSDSSDISSKCQTLEFNFLGLPMRSGEKECSYYMRTGTCKYGSSCRFHHPEPTTVVGDDSSSGYGNGPSIPSQLVSSSWSSPRAFNETSSFTTATFSQTQRAPSSNPEWNDYQDQSLSSVGLVFCKAATYPTSERSLPTPPAFALNNLPTEINFRMPRQQDMVLEEYPERPGEPECNFFMKTGDCKFKYSCKFHHPKNRISKPRANSFTLNDKGLPLRPDQPVCTHYHRYGICKYGPACKYDHSSSFANLPTPFDQPHSFSN
ncbi:hypothetical protein OROGR_030863 [Orobanche gracilis]